jgi:hypothetical protein
MGIRWGHDLGSPVRLNRARHLPASQACCIIDRCCIVKVSIRYEAHGIAYAVLYNLPFLNALMKAVVVKPLALSMRYVLSSSRFSFKSNQVWRGYIFQFDGPPLPK